LAGSDEVCDAAFRQLGIIRAKNIEEMFHHAIAFTYQPLPASNRIAIVTNAGGPGVMATDTAIENGLELAKFSPETTKTLKKSLPRMANIKNPVDLIGDARADRYDAALTNISRDDNVDGILCILTPQSMTDIEAITHLICRVEREMDKPLLCSFMGGSDVSSGIEMLQKRHIPHYSLPESACQSFAATVRYQKWLSRPSSTVRNFQIDRSRARETLEKCLERGQSYLPEADALEILDSYGFPILKHGVAKTAEQAVHLGQKIGFPVALKIHSTNVLHKSDIGGVAINLENEQDVARGFDHIINTVKAIKPDAQILGVLVEEMARPGKEVIIGMKRDPSFGPVVMFGAGGIYVEFLRDIVFRVAPITELDTREMMRETRSYVLLSGIRGEQPGDIEFVEECLGRLSQLALDFPEINELDINPLVVYAEGKGAAILDARMTLTAQTSTRDSDGGVLP